VSLQDAFELPPDARVQQTGGGGSLVSRVRWQHADGSTATWESRLARKRGFIEVVRDGIVMRIMARPAVAVRLRRCNDLSGVSFFLGGGLYHHYTSAIADQMLYRAEWLTAYTPSTWKPYPSHSVP